MREAEALSKLREIGECKAAPSDSDDTSMPQASDDNAKALAMASLHMEHLQRELLGLRAQAQQVSCIVRQIEYKSS